MLLMIDNYDSFTYNLVQYFGELGEDVRVVRNDEITLEQIEQLAAGAHLYLARAVHAERGRHLACRCSSASPAACRSSACASATRHRPGVRRQGRARADAHARQDSPIDHTGAACFKACRIAFSATRYHSLVIERATLPAMPRSHRVDRRRRDHGRAPPDAAGRRRAVPSRVDPDRARPRAAEELSADVGRTGRMSIAPTKRWCACIEHREIFHDEMLSLMRQIMSGEVSPVLIAALTMGLRVKKETIGEIAAAAQVMREFATKVAAGRSHASGRLVRHRRRSAAHLQHLDRGDVRRRRGRRARRQARRAQRVVGIRQRRRARSARRQHQSDARAGRAVHRRDRHRLHVRAESPRRDEARGAGAQGARRAHHLQHPRPAHQSGRRAEPGDGRVPPRSGRHPGARAAAPGRAARADGLRQGRHGRGLAAAQPPWSAS